MILVGIGANLPASDGASPLSTCRAAAAALDALPGLRAVGLSRWFRTAPVPPSGQPDYINGVARLRGAADPAVLLACAASDRGPRGPPAQHARRARAPSISTSLPWARLANCAANRPTRSCRTRAPICAAFVLAPLLDVAPDWVHPALRQPAAALLAGLPPQGVRPLGAC